MIYVYYMKINLIIATYGGKLYKYRDNNTKEYYLRYNLELLNCIETNITQITIMRPKINKEHDEIKDYYNFNNLKIDNIKDKIKIIDCENIGISYGQFFTGISKNRDFDYHIFIEDDYIVFENYFEKKFVDEYLLNKNDSSLLCSFIYKKKIWNIVDHATNSNEPEENINKLIFKLSQYTDNLQNLPCNIPDFSLCILNKSTVDEIFYCFQNIDNILNLFDINFNNICLHQILFGYVFKIANINIFDMIDSYMNLFYNSGSNTISLCNNENIDDFISNKNPIKRLENPLFIPLDILYPNNYYNVLRIMIQHLIDKNKFIYQFIKLQNIKKTLNY